MTDIRVPVGLPLRRGHRRVPDRGRGHRGRPHPVDLGHLRPYPGPDRRGPYRRRRVRPLPPAPRGPRPDRRAWAWARTASPSRGRACCPAAAPKPNRHGPRLLPPAGRRPAGARRRALADALPLGPAAGTGGRRRLARPGHRRPVRRVRRWSCTTRSATGSPAGPPSTSPGARRSSATRSGDHAPGRTEPAEVAARRPTT